MDDYVRRPSAALSAELALLAAQTGNGQEPKVRVPSALMAAAEAVRMVARKLCEESAANVEAAAGMLDMLREEQRVFAEQVMEASENFAVRVGEFMTRGVACAEAITLHREQIMAIAKTAAEQPPMITDPGER